MKKFNNNLNNDSDNINKSESFDDIVSAPNISDNISKISLSNSSTDSDKIRKKRQELSISANKTINIHNYNITLYFD
jgi:hypothetical protein